MTHNSPDQSPGEFFYADEVANARQQVEAARQAREQMVSPASNSTFAHHETADAGQYVARTVHKRRTPVIIASIVGLAGISTAAYVIHDHMNDGSLPLETAKTTPSIATEPTGTAITETTPTAANVPTANEFKSSVIGCIPAADVTVNGVSGVKWVGVYQKNGKMFATNPNNFRNEVSGTVAASVCLNSDTIVFDQSLTDQTGKQTYTYDAAGMKLITNADGINNGVNMYEKSAIWESLKLDYKYARRIDAKRLAQTVQRKAGEIAGIGTYFMNHNLADGTNRDVLIAAGNAAIQAAYLSQAQTQGFSTETIAFQPINAPAADAMTFDSAPYPLLDAKCKNHQPNTAPYTCYVFQPETGVWQYQINPVVQGVTP